MTWVVGVPGLNVGALAVSDARVTFCDTATGEVIRSWDGVRKIHPIGPNALLGFAGSIYLGFKCVRDFRAFLGPNPKGLFVNMNAALPEWSKRVASAWDDPQLVPSDEADAGCHVLILSIHPEQDVGDMASWPMSYGFILRSPEFTIEEIPITKIGSIGSGARRYIQELEELTESWTDIFNMGTTPVPGLTRLGVAAMLQSAIQRTPDESIGDALHMAQITREGVDISSIQTTALHTSGESVSMPPVATTWEEFQQMRPHVPSSAIAIGTSRLSLNL